MREQAPGETPVASTRWEEIVRLAQEVDADCRGGTIDPERVVRLAREVIEFQRALVTMRPNVPPAKVSTPDDP
jgi:hypothetical protein